MTTETCHCGDCHACEWAALRRRSLDRRRRRTDRERLVRTLFETAIVRAALARARDNYDLLALETTP